MVDGRRLSVTIFLIIFFIVNIKDIRRLIVSLKNDMKITKEGKSWRKIKPKEILFINILRFMILMQQAEGRKKLLSLIIRENNNKELCI